MANDTTDRELLSAALASLQGYRREMGDTQPCDAEKAIAAHLACPSPAGEPETINKQRLRKLAQAATPGPWTTISRGAYWGEEEGDVVGHDGQDIDGAEFVKPLDRQETTRGQAWFRDTAYIAAANPVTVLSLLDEIDTLQARAEHARSGAQKQLAAYATLVKSMEARLSDAAKRRDEHAEAVRTLQSERDANAILTAENAEFARAAQEARRVALEDAAKVCEAMHEEDRPSDYAYAVRTLAGKEGQG